MNDVASLPDDYVGHAIVGQIDGRGSKHVIWVNNRSGTRAAAYPPEDICRDQTWATAEPLFTQLDLDHAVASERAAVVAFVSRAATAAFSRHTVISDFVGGAFEIVARIIVSGAHNGQAAMGGEVS
jgi:hypothetical protein